MKKVKTTLLVASCIALASQISLSLFHPGFIITLAVVILPVLLYFNREFNPILLTFATGIISPLFRGLMLYASGESQDFILASIPPDMLFYFTYGILFYCLYWRRPNTGLTGFFVSVMLCDFLSNVLELSVMLRFGGYSYELFQNLAIIAFVRSIIALAAILFYQYYTSLLLQQEHEERYRKLVLMTSKIKNEIYFMMKNNGDIEQVMKEAYYLHKELCLEGSSDPAGQVQGSGEAHLTAEQRDRSERLKMLSLNVAKDVHEIKKDYLSVIKGLEDLFDDKVDEVRMDIADIVEIIQADVKEHVRRNHLDLSVQFRVEHNFSVEKHYYLVSVLRNLIYNAIDAVSGRTLGSICVSITKSGKACRVSVADNGAGIKAEDSAYIFNMGFSTKFNEETGDICRGIGLYHVKEIVEEVFGGKISAHSGRGKGAEFIVLIDAGRLEGSGGEERPKETNFFIGAANSEEQEALL